MKTDSILHILYRDPKSDPLSEYAIVTLKYILVLF